MSKWLINYKPNVSKIKEIVRIRKEMRIEKHYKKPMNPKGKKFVDL
jgi:hypothetical protein